MATNRSVATNRGADLNIAAVEELMLLDEERVKHSLARVCTVEGATLGTAFFVLGTTVAITCHHLVESTEKVFLDFGLGSLCEGSIAKEDRFPDVDIALIRCSDAPPVCALPLVAEQVNVQSYWTKGYHYHGTNVVEPLPVAGNVIGTTDIEFTTFSGMAYRLSGVLLLRDDVIDAGLSGAPVLDPETGCVFALINAKFARDNSTQPAGFALPLWRAANGHPQLKQLFEANQATVPRYGRFMNRLGAEEVCRQQRAANLERLIRRKRFLSEMYCARPIEGTVEMFFRSDSLILPVVGNAGVGKSMLLAEIARRDYGQALMFLLSHELKEEETDLSTAVTSSLRKVSPKLMGQQGGASLVVSALGSGGGRLVVLLDGLNETPVALLENFRSWLESSVDWLEQCGAKLIVSSRPEFWEVWKGLLPEDLIYRDSDPKQDETQASAVHLYDFSQAEAEKVMELYGLGGTLSANDVQHPLMARIYWEMKLSGQLTVQVPTTRYGALRRFIDLKCENVARALAPTVIRSSVEAGLKRAARASLVKGGFEIASEEFETLFQDAPRMGVELVQEGLFTPTSAGVRFIFDEIAEFLQGWVIDLEAIADWTSTGDHRWRITAGAVVYAILRLQNEGEEEKVAESMRLITIARTRKNGSSLKYENAFVLLLQQLRRPEAYVEHIAAVIRVMTDGEEYFDIFNLRGTVAGINLPLRLKFELLKPFLTKENSYDFEPHHWHQLDWYVFQRKGHTATVLAGLIQVTPLPAFEIMVEWLSDRTLLRERKSDVSDAAAALLFYFRCLSLEGQCDLLARSEIYDARRQLSRLVEAEPYELFKICRRWVESDDASLLSLAVHIAVQIAGQPEASELEDDLYQVLSRARGRVNAETEIAAMKGIARISKYRDTVLDDLLTLFRQANTEITGYSLAEWVGTHFDAVASAIEDVIRSSLDAEKSCEALLAVSRQNLAPAEKERLFSLFEIGIDAGLIEKYKFSTAIESALHSVNSEFDRQRMYLIAQVATQESSDARRCLIYFATSTFRNENEYRKELADAILDLLVKREIDPDNESLLIEKLVEMCSSAPYYLRHLSAIGAHLPQDRFHLQLLRIVYPDHKASKLLTEWLEAGTLLRPFGPTQNFLDRVRSGEAPEQAAENVLMELLGYR